MKAMYFWNSGPLQRLTTQALALSGAAGVGGGTSTGNQGVEGGGEAGIGDRDVFEELCSNHRSSMSEFDDMWTDKEKEITFTQESQQEEERWDLVTLVMAQAELKLCNCYLYFCSSVLSI